MSTGHGGVNTVALAIRARVPWGDISAREVADLYDDYVALLDDMSFDAWLVAFGLARVLVQLDLAAPIWAYQTLTVTMILDAILLVRFFKHRGTTPPPFRDSLQIPVAALAIAEPDSKSGT